MQKTTKGAESGRSRISLDDVRIFAVVARSGSINSAASELRLQASTVSRRIDYLEDRLNARLFARSATGMSLTEAGQRVMGRAQTIDILGEEFERALVETDAHPAGRVTVAAPDGLATYCIAPHIGAFANTYPDIIPILDCGFWTKHPPPDAPELTITFDNTGRKLDEVWSQLITVHYCYFASSEYLETYGAPTSLAALADHRICGNLAQNQQQEVWGPRQTALRALTRRGSATNCGAATLLSVLGGGGIGLLPTYAVNHVPAGSLRMLDIEDPMTFKVWLAYRQDAILPARVRTVADWLRVILDPDGNPWFRAEFVHPRDFGRPRENSVRRATQRAGS